MVGRFGGPRRTRIIRPDQIDDVSLEAMLDDPELVDEPCAVTLATSQHRRPRTGRRTEAGDVRSPRRAVARESRRPR
jgi:hypothetical protein